MKINIKYIASFIILFITEIFIALFINDTIIRPYIGDVLVVILMYTFIRGFIQKPIKFLPAYLFCIASTVEVMQYYRIVDLLHLQNNKVISTIIGTSFDIKDILCYLIGSLILIIWDNLSNKVSRR